MPSSLTHYWFAKDQMLQEAERLVFMREEENKCISYVGAQGPDLLFFYGAVPWRKRERVREITEFGNHLHEVDMAEKMIRLIHYANHHHDAIKDTLYSYIYGAMLHYSLDRNVHPFIFFRSGFSISERMKYDVYHVQYETMVDVSVLNHYRSNPYHVTTKKALRANPERMQLVSAMYASKETKINDRSLMDAWMDMRAVESFLFDPIGIKRWLIRLIGKQQSKMYALIHPGDTEGDSIDYLNIEHHQWKHPGSGQEYQTSFWDLYELAQSDAKQFLSILLRAYRGEDVDEALILLCRDINYSGLQKGQSLTYHSSVYDKI